MSVTRRFGPARLLQLVILLAGLPASGQQDQSPPPAPMDAASLPDLKPDATGGLSQAQDLRQIVMDRYRANYSKPKDNT